MIMIVITIMIMVVDDDHDHDHDGGDEDNHNNEGEEEGPSNRWHTEELRWSAPRHHDPLVPLSDLSHGEHIVI